MRQVAERYGVHVTHNGMCKCPFHNDKNPSMKIYEKQFHCFGCKANGDVISFTGRLFNIPPKDAAQKLADDFYISYDNRYPAQRVQRRHMPRDEDVFAALSISVIIIFSFLKMCFHKHIIRIRSKASGMT